MARNTPEKREQRRQRAAEALKERQAAERRRKMLTIGGVVAALVAIVAIIFGITQAMDTTGETPDNVPSVAQDPAADAEGDAVPGKLDGYGILVGDPEAARTVTIYEDLQCPACANLEAELGDEISEAIDAGEIQVDYRLLSFLDRASTNDYSSRALNALLVVLDTAGIDAFRAFHDDLYANQPAEGGPGFDDDELVERAVEAGAEESEIRADIEDKVYEQWIKNATDQMSKDGVNSTPTIRIDGEDADPQQLAELLQQ